MEAMFTVIGAAFALVASLGLLAALAMWSANQILEATRFGKIIVQWCGEKLTKERDERRAGA